MRTVALIAIALVPALACGQAKTLDLFFGTMKVGDVGKMPQPAEPPTLRALGLTLYKIEAVKDSFFVVTAEHAQTTVEAVSFVVKGPTKDLADGQRFIPKDLWKAVGTQKVGNRTLFVLEQVAEKPEEKALRIKKEQFVMLTNARAQFEMQLGGPKEKASDKKKWQDQYDAKFKAFSEVLGLTPSAAKAILEEGALAKWPTK